MLRENEMIVRINAKSTDFLGKEVTMKATGISSSITSEEVENKETYLGNWYITGYVVTGNPTASGVWPRPNHTVAMNKTQMTELGIVYGDKLRIDGMGTYVIEDCGCKANVADVFCETVQQCYSITGHRDVYLIKRK